MVNDEKLSKIVSLAKRRGFVFQGSEIYGGLAGMWDYGHYGRMLKENVKQLWWKHFVDGRSDMYGVDAATLMSRNVWRASGHTEGFADPMVVCTNCGARHRADHLEEGESGRGHCPVCDSPMNSDEPQQFNMMFETRVGAAEGEDNTAYLRPETAQGIFTNFKNTIDTVHPRIPFGIAQIGKAFRNEISPREFLFRTREFEMMEIEYFVRENEWEQYFEEWREAIQTFLEVVGIGGNDIREHEVPEDERAHYSTRTIDFEYAYPGKGWDELLGLAYRSDFDLSAHAEASGVDISYRDPDTGERFIPHVIEPSFGVDRLIFALLSSAYTEDEMDGEQRTYLALRPTIAPTKVAVFPLLRNKPELVEKAREVYEAVRKEISATEWDDNGNIGKRYRRQDEIGTPACVTVDFQTLEDDTVTVRDRDTGKQERKEIKELTDYLSALYSN